MLKLHRGNYLSIYIPHLAISLESAEEAIYHHPKTVSPSIHSILSKRAKIINTFHLFSFAPPALYTLMSQHRKKRLAVEDCCRLVRTDATLTNAGVILDIVQTDGNAGYTYWYALWWLHVEKQGRVMIVEVRSESRSHQTV